VFEQSHQTYGSPRVYHQLKNEGYAVSLGFVALCMKSLGLKANRVKRYRKTAVGRKSQQHLIASNLLNRRFNPDSTNQRWVSDITFIPTKQGFLHLCAVMDLYSRKIIGWSMSKRPNTQLVLEALEMAYDMRKPPSGVLVHSDQGVQYSSYMYRSKLESYRMEISMSRKGNCHDNAVIESFFHSLKCEWLSNQVLLSFEATQQRVFKYIEMFYNTKRLHSANQYRSPVDFESQCA
jgi:putative transposase